MTRLENLAEKIAAENLDAGYTEQTADFAIVEIKKLAGVKGRAVMRRDSR